MPDNFWDNLGSNLGTQFGEAIGASLFGGSAGDSNPEAIWHPQNIANMGSGATYGNGGYTANYNPNEVGAYNSLFGIAQNNFNEAGTANPYAIGQEYYNRMRAMQQPGEARRLSDLRDNLYASGRLGLGTGANGANPELAAYYQSLFETDNALGAQALLAGQDIVDRTLGRGRSALDGAMGISNRGLDMIKLGGILGTYGRPVGSSGNGGWLGNLFGGNAPAVGGSNGGALNGAVMSPGGPMGDMPMLPGGNMGGTTPFIGSTPMSGPGLDSLAGGGLNIGDGSVITNPDAGGGGGSVSGGDANTDVLNSLFGLEGGTASGNFVDGLLGPIDETLNFFGDGASAIGGLFSGSGSSGGGLSFDPVGVQPGGGLTTNSPTLDNSPEAVLSNGSTLFGDDPQAGSNASQAVAAVLSGQAALSQLAAQDLTAIAQAMPPGMGQAFAGAIASGNIGYAEQILRALVNHSASSGGGRGFGWEGVGIDRGLEMAASGSAGNQGLNLAMATGRPISG